MESKKSLEKGVKIKAIAVGAACATAVGCFFGGYLIYKAYYAPGWHEKDSKLYYISEDTKENAVGLYQIDGSTYLFDSDGYMLTGWQTYKGDTYYFNSDGVMQKGKTTIDGTEYYFSPDSGIFYTGTVTLYGISYYFNQYGFTDDGFITVDGVERFYNSQGEIVIGWAKIDDKQYYFKENGEKTRKLDRKNQRSAEKDQ